MNVIGIVIFVILSVAVLALLGFEIYGMIRDIKKSKNSTVNNKPKIKKKGEEE